VGPDPAFLVRRTFQIRRVIWTKDVIAFARAGEEFLIDAIPLSEIKSIEAVGSRLDGLSEMDGRVRDQGSMHLLLYEVEGASSSIEGKIQSW
jgi:hypothetical protein